MQPSFNHDDMLMKPYLEHHGILGQKWGVRRYQNPDGTLTEEGKKRYYGTGNTGKVLTREGAKAVAKDMIAIDKLRLKKGRDSKEVRDAQKAFKTKWGEGGDGMRDWASEHDGVIDKSDKLYDKVNEKEAAQRDAKQKKFVDRLGKVTQLLPEDIPEYKEMKSAADDVKKVTKTEDDYWSNEDLRKKYATIAAKEFYKDMIKKYPGWGTEEEAIDFYVNEDGDQGEKDSFHYYMKDTGRSMDDYQKRRHEAYAKYNNAKDKYIDAVLGPYKDKEITYTDQDSVEYKHGMWVKKKVKTTAKNYLNRQVIQSNYDAFGL